MLKNITSNFFPDAKSNSFSVYKEMRWMLDYLFLSITSDFYALLSLSIRLSL